MRELQQIISLAVSVIALVISFKKIRAYRPGWKWWVPMLVALFVNALYYLNVLIGSFGGFGGDISATRSMITLLMLLIYSVMMPPRVRI